MVLGFRPGPLRDRPTLAAALAGGVISIPLVLADYWLSGAGNTFSAELVVVGGLLAGHLAAAPPGRAARAGFGAGAIGTLPGFAWLLLALLEGDPGLSGYAPSVAVGFVAALLAVAIAGGGFLGALGGSVGGWLTRGVRSDGGGSGLGSA